jgi:predicted alpha/beta superfamily hydrolase
MGLLSCKGKTLLEMGKDYSILLVGLKLYESGVFDVLLCKIIIMRPFFLSLLLLISTSLLFGQATFILSDIPENTPEGDSIYITGTFNDWWNPGDPENALYLNADSLWEIVLGIAPEGLEIQYKFTRGDWGTVEKGANGEEITNRYFTYGNGDTTYISILSWADQGGGTGESTAADNVEIVDEAFYIPQLDRNRRIWIYLPPDYEADSVSYPVLYMHDGQNVFDASTSYAGEWEVDETLNQLHENGYSVPIVVAVDNGGNHRIDEYSPWVHTSYGGGEGDDYVSFLAETLKPFIDENYRTLSDPENTAILGSSMGGLISYYAAIARQDVFHKAGIFSPSYWFSDSVWTLLETEGVQESLRVYQMTGSLEPPIMVSQTYLMNTLLQQHGAAEENLMVHIQEGGNHNEALWRSQFGEAYLWLFSEYITDVPIHAFPRRISLYPNPARETLFFDEQMNMTSILLFDIAGKPIPVKIGQKNRIEVGHLSPGVYIIKLETTSGTYTQRFIKK